MRLIDLLKRDHIVVPLEAATVDEATAVLARRLADAGALADPEPVQRWLGGRRAGETISLVPRVALPHHRTDAVAELTVALGIAPEPLGGGGTDAGTRIVALILAPHDAATAYLQTVSALARLFRDPSVLDAMLAATSADDVRALPQLGELRLGPRLSVRDIMIPNVEAVSPDMGVREAIDIMMRRRQRALPVVGDDRDVLGIISEWDVMRGMLPQIPRGGDDTAAGSDKPLRVRDIMTRSVLCVPEDMPLQEAASLMINKDVEQFPVVREGKLSGFLTRSDIIRKLFGR